MFAQVTTLQLQDGTLDAFLRRFQDVIAPDVAMQPGFGGSLLLVDPPRSKVLAVEFWETEADLRTSELVTESGQSAGVQSLFAGPPTREVYEVSVQVELTEQGAAHMRGI